MKKQENEDSPKSEPNVSRDGANYVKDGNRGPELPVSPVNDNTRYGTNESPIESLQAKFSDINNVEHDKHEEENGHSDLSKSIEKESNCAQKAEFSEKESNVFDKENELPGEKR